MWRQGFGIAESLLIGYNKIQLYYAQTEDNEAWNIKAREVFHSELNRQIPNPDPSKYTAPEPGPLENEVLEERFNRLSYALKALALMLTLSKWNGHKFDTKNAFESVMIPKEAIPSWMVPKAVMEETETRPDPYPPKVFPWRWDRNWGPASDREDMKLHLDELDEENIAPPPDKSEPRYDPMVGNGGTILDKSWAWRKRL